MNNQVKVIALPFAGANKYSYRPFQNEKRDNLDWDIYELPGRGARIAEDFLTDVESIVDDIFNQFQSVIKNSEYIIYGHSLGTILGFELVKKIMEYNLPLPLFLFFTGRGSPSVYEREKLSNLEESKFWEKVNEIGGLPSEVIENNELREFLSPILRSDFKAVENYTYQSVKTPLNIPIIVGIGNEELIGKDKIKWKNILKWQNETSVPIDVEFYKGNHFFILENYQEIVNKIDLILINQVSDSQFLEK